MVERQDIDDEPIDKRHDSNASLGIDGIKIELQDFSEAAYTHPKDSV
jgi:hypothetical protein